MQILHSGLKKTKMEYLTIRIWMSWPVKEFQTFRVMLFTAVITELSWRSHATMVTFSFVILSSTPCKLCLKQNNETFQSNPSLAKYFKWKHFFIFIYYKQKHCYLKKLEKWKMFPIMWHIQPQKNCRCLNNDCRVLYTRPSAI